jgi:signal transduction histidine kinase
MPLSSLPDDKRPTKNTAPTLLPGDNPWALSRWIVAAYVSIGAAIVLVLGIAAWGVFHDLELVRTTLLQSETNRLRTHGLRTIALIQDELVHASAPSDLSALRGSKLIEKLRQHWATAIFKDDSRDYTAIVDKLGVIAIHTHPQEEGKSLGRAWYDRKLEDIGDGIVETSNAALTANNHCIDVRLPIFFNGEEIGSYHTGLSQKWLGQLLAQKQKNTWRLWSAILTSIVLTELLAGAALFYISGRMTMLKDAVKLSRARRFAELGQLMAGIAHEIRNPLNAMRLNLHVLSRQPWESACELPSESDPFPSDPGFIIHETTREIERIEGLLRILLGYARPDQPYEECLDARREIQVTVGFLKSTLERAEIAIHMHFPIEPAIVCIDRDRLRQIVLNLINNAVEATGDGGTIHVSVSVDEDIVEIAVADDGPGVPLAEREQIFEPFYSTKELGTGLGLALVRRFAEEAGGVITCERNEPAGACFKLRLAHRTGDPAVGVARDQSHPYLTG